jgi:hypothetical protein
VDSNAGRLFDRARLSAHSGTGTLLRYATGVCHSVRVATPALSAERSSRGFWDAFGQRTRLALSGYCVNPQNNVRNCTETHCGRSGCSRRWKTQDSESWSPAVHEVFASCTEATQANVTTRWAAAPPLIARTCFTPTTFAAIDLPSSNRRIRNASQLVGEECRPGVIAVINHTDSFRCAARSCSFAVGYPIVIALHHSERRCRPDGSC